jgi:hypothetical protein
VTPPQSQESQHDSPQLVSQEQEPFEIEIVVPESPEAKDSPAEEPEQQQAKDDGDDDDKEYYSLSDSESKKLYRDVDESEYHGVEAWVPIDRLQALLVHLGITTAPKYWIKGVPRRGQVECWAIAEIFWYDHADHCNLYTDHSNLYTDHFDHSDSNTCFWWTDYTKSS